MRALPSIDVSLAAALLVAGARTQEPAGAIRFDATTMIVPAGSHPVAELVDQTAAFLGCNILTDAREMQAVGNIELQTPMKLGREDTELLISEMLFAKCLVLVPRDDAHKLYEVVYWAGPRGRAAFSSPPFRSVEEILRQPTLKQPVSTSLSLHGIKAVVAVNALRPMFAAAAGPNRPALTMATPREDVLLLSGVQSDVAEAIRAVRDVDGEPPAGAKEGEAAAAAAKKRIAELEAQVEMLQKRIAELEKRLGGG